MELIDNITTLATNDPFQAANYLAPSSLPSFNCSAHYSRFSSSSRSSNNNNNNNINPIIASANGTITHNSNFDNNSFIINNNHTIDAGAGSNNDNSIINDDMNGTFVVDLAGSYPMKHATIIFGYITPFVVAISVMTNVFVVAVLTRKHMRSGTNIILCSLAMVDLFTILSGSPWYLYIYTLGHYKDNLNWFACHSHNIFIEGMPVFLHNASIWLTLLLAGQRYFCIRYPSLACRWCTKPRIKQSILIIIIAAFISQMSRFFDNEFEFDARCNVCLQSIAPWVNWIGQDIYFMTYFSFRVVFVYLLPIVALVTLNCLLYHALKRAERKRTELLGPRYELEEVGWNITVGCVSETAYEEEDDDQDGRGGGRGAGNSTPKENSPSSEHSRRLKWADPIDDDDDDDEQHPNQDKDEEALIGAANHINDNDKKANESTGLVDDGKANDIINPNESQKRVFGNLVPSSSERSDGCDHQQNEADKSSISSASSSSSDSDSSSSSGEDPQENDGTTRKQSSSNVDQLAGDYHESGVTATCCCFLCCLLRGKFLHKSNKKNMNMKNKRSVKYSTGAAPPFCSSSSYISSSSSSLNYHQQQHQLATAMIQHKASKRRTMINNTTTTSVVVVDNNDDNNAVDNGVGGVPVEDPRAGSTHLTRQQQAPVSRVGHPANCYQSPSQSGLQTTSTKSSYQQEHQTPSPNQISYSLTRRKPRRVRDSHRTTLMLIVVVTVYLLVEIPSAFFTTVHIIISATTAAYQEEDINALEGYIKLYSNFLIIVSYSINFSIYCSMSKKFRVTFHDLVTCKPSWTYAGASAPLDSSRNARNNKRLKPEADYTSNKGTLAYIRRNTLI